MTFPEQQSRTRRFTVGLPRSFAVSRDGSQILFLRSPADDPTLALWAWDVTEGTERLLVDPGALGLQGALSAEERARRERRRELAGGITAFSASADGSAAVFVAAGGLWHLHVASASAVEVAEGPVFDPTLDPTGRSVAWCAGADLRVAAVDGRVARVLLAADGPEVTWGQAEFVAAEEMGRDRGFWWSPDGGQLLAARVDVAPVGTWWVADPAHPDRRPVAHHYPAAGGADADVSLWCVDLDGSRREVRWDRATHPYLVAVRWDDAGPVVAVQRRDHGQALVLAVDPATGATTELARSDDPAWVEWPTGLPVRLPDGALAWYRDDGDAVRLTVDGADVTPRGLEVRGVVPDGDGLLVRASVDPERIGLWRWSPQDGVVEVPLDGPDGGVVGVPVTAGGTTVVVRRGLEDMDAPAQVRRDGRLVGRIAAAPQEEPLVIPAVRLAEYGPDALRAGLLLPTGHVPGTRLPVLVYPYGGPGAQRVLADRRVWLESQWRADQGFAVLVTDGHGSPGRGPAWARSIRGDFATRVLEDQVVALRAAAADCPDLDLDRVGITGWSFGGYLAALAVLRRPEMFHVAVAGAPVTDWRLYDTFYTERYLGHPDADPGAYDRSSLLADAPRLERPLLIVHGLVDDNVVVAHTLRLSQALLEAGRPHSVLPVSGVTHVASQNDVEARLLEVQMEYLSRHLGARPVTRP